MGRGNPSLKAFVWHKTVQIPEHFGERIAPQGHFLALRARAPRRAMPSSQRQKKSDCTPRALPCASRSGATRLTALAKTGFFDKMTTGNESSRWYTRDYFSLRRSRISVRRSSSLLGLGGSAGAAGASSSFFLAKSASLFRLFTMKNTTNARIKK